ncbi:hypothetical protein Tco_0024398 [Tanacetum coccineum]
MSLDTYSTTSDIVFDEWVNSHRSDEISLEEGLTLVENDKDIEKMFEVASYHGTIDLYICHTPQVYLVDYYLKNVTVDDSDEEVTSIYRSHEKEKKNVDTMSFEELVAWEKEEAESPSVLRSPHVWKNLKDVGNGKGKVLLDDFEVVGNGKGKVLLDDFEDVGKDKDDSDLNLSAPLRLTNSSNFNDAPTHVDEKSSKIIPGPAGFFQTDRIHQLNNFNDAPTQEYIRKLYDDVSEGEDFKMLSWVKALEYINDNSRNRGGSLRYQSLPQERKT